MQKLFPHLLSFLLLTLFSCTRPEEPQPEDAYYDAFTPRLVSRAVLEAWVQALPPRALHAAGKIYLQGQYLFVNEPYEGIHVIDNRNPARPRPVSFLRIPGNIDLALKGSLLYADNGPDLVTLDVSNPGAAVVKSRVRDAFRELPMPEWGPLAPSATPDKRPANTVVVGWKKIKVAYPAGNNPSGWGGGGVGTCPWRLPTRRRRARARARRARAARWRGSRSWATTSIRSTPTACACSA
ncbi:MAG TPA: hypothetical protein VF629_21315 [Hymenobacter sp.]|jgi:hypothetical protein|uniref:hypothetical protein n=1 Tax=Hymenobacter sp. TaxID=1898978 RepID=UPI002ED798C7